ncbi:MAG: cyclic nucleotide-binding domain-containing protein [Pseudomonadota bacterium]
MHTDRPSATALPRGGQIVPYPEPGCGRCKLRQACLPGALGAAELAHFEQIVTQRRRVARRATLFQAGEPGTKVYVLRLGHFKTYALDECAERHVTGFQMAGDLLGLDAIAGGAHRFTAVALEDSEVCEIPRLELDAFMAQAPSVMDKFHQVLGGELVDSKLAGVLLAGARSERRFAAFLLRLSQRYAALGYAPNVFQLRMSRGDIGSYLGFSAEGLSRMIARFRQLGWIGVKRRTVEIFQRADLEAFALGTPSQAGARNRIKF